MGDFTLTLSSDESYFDISINSDGDITTDDSFDTAILMSVFGEKRASESEVVRPEFRRGDWSNELNSEDGYEIGSKYYLLEQARATQESLNHSISTLEDGFQWMIDDNFLKQVIVTGEITYRGISNIVKLLAPNNEVETALFQSWAITGN